MALYLIRSRRTKSGVCHTLAYGATPVDVEPFRKGAQSAIDRTGKHVVVETVDAATGRVVAP